MTDCKDYDEEKCGGCAELGGTEEVGCYKPVNRKEEPVAKLQLQRRVKLPLVDKETLTPNYKMPDCPNCGEDELRMIGINEAECLKCGVLLTRKAT